MSKAKKSIYIKLIELVESRIESDFKYLPSDIADKSIVNLKRSDLVNINSDKDFVESCYMTLLNRVGDPKSVRAKILNLKTNTSREGILDSFLKSKEYSLKKAVFFKEPTKETNTKAENTIYFDVTDYVATRGMTGIQRAVREIIPQFLDKPEIRVIKFNYETLAYDVVEKESLIKFFKNPKNPSNPSVEDVLAITQIGDGDIFVDLDSAWNVYHKRSQLYPQLKDQGVKIVSYVYDLVPILKPGVMQANALRNIVMYFSAVIDHSDLILTDSANTEQDIRNLCSELCVEMPSTIVTKLSVNPAKSKLSKLKNDTSIPVDALLGRKFILFVGTVEPRKRQDLVMQAFLKLKLDHPELSLVIVGKEGWDNKSTINLIESNADNGVYWLQGIDDEELDWLYRRCHLVTYISDYEGFGLPVAEGLSYGKPTVTSDNSSIYEVGLDFADYVKYNSIQEIVEVLEKYLTDHDFYKYKSEHIKNNYFIPSWSTVADFVINSVSQIKSSEVTLSENSRATQLQHVFISIRPEAVLQNIKLQEKYSNFVKSYLIVTSKDLLNDFAKVIESTGKEVVLIDEKDMLGNQYKTFKKLDHLEKNWVLRSSLVDLPEVENLFIMIDDDNIPFKKTTIEDYIDGQGRYVGYYFYDLLRWNERNTSFDKGMQRAKYNSIKFNLELKAYASHRSQIINKELFKEAVEFSTTKGMKSHPSEWETYFNYVASKYPSLLSKRPAKVLNWPGRPSSWESDYLDTDYDTENYYEELYGEGGIFEGLSIHDQQKKTSVKDNQLSSYRRTKSENELLEDTVRDNDMVHTMVKFKDEKDRLQVYLSGLPYVVKVIEASVARFNINCKVVHKGRKKKDDRLHIVTKRMPGQRLLNKKLVLLTKNTFQETTESVPIVSNGGSRGKYYRLSVYFNGKELINDGGECLIYVCHP